MSRIVIVDDEEDLRTLLKMSLTNFGHETQEVSSFEELKSFLVSFKPELIILDVMLRGENGRDICKALKLAEHKHIPIILYSANPAMLENYNECQADYILDKPFSMSALKDIVNTALLPGLPALHTSNAG